jgi:NADH-quinone oxidoreductase subunit C
VEAKEIYDALKGRLPDAVVGFHDQTVDPYIMIAPARVREVLTLLRDDPALKFEMLLLVSGVDWRDRFDVVYHLTSLTRGRRIALKATLPHDDPHIPSVAAIYPTANWHERETYDLMGIVFDGHPDLRRIFLPDDWEGHPLRKDYVFPESYHGIANNL